MKLVLLLALIVACVAQTDIRFDFKGRAAPSVVPLLAVALVVKEERDGNRSALFGRSCRGAAF
jgi:hypothetical protein